MLARNIFSQLFSRDSQNKKNLKRREINLEEQCRIGFKFFFCGYKDREEMKREDDTYGDLVELNCNEEFPLGKTLLAYKHLGSHFGDFDFVGKMNIDTVLYMDKTIQLIDYIAINGTLCGRMLERRSSKDSPLPEGWLSVGGGVSFISKDLAEWVKSSHCPLPKKEEEDVEFGKCIQKSEKELTFVDVGGELEKLYGLRSCWTENAKSAQDLISHYENYFNQHNIVNFPRQNVY